MMGPRKGNGECMTFVLYVIILLPNFVGAEKRPGYCEFPEYLWKTTKSGSDIVWITRTSYIGTSSDWSNQQEVKVSPTDILVTLGTRSSCFDQAANVSIACEEKRVFETAICLSEEPGHKYRVQIERNGKALFTCLKFERRNANIVQVWAAAEQRVNEDRLCLDGVLERIPWPWIARTQAEWSFCPLVGGFDFKAKMDGNKRGVCSHQWRPSRLESECILGEGIQFFFPDDRCSIFPETQMTKTLYCWGSWQEDDYIFILLSEQYRVPQYSLRISSSLVSRPKRESTAYFYFSPVAPVRGRGKPPKGVTYAEMSMVRSEAGVCYDESEECEEFVREGKCTNAALHKYANYCKKSCGLCGEMADLVPSVLPECYFPKDWRGDWLWYETSRTEDVSIGPGQLSFSHLGSFLCKSKHWNSNKYKMMSHYSNGCRPRYTCMQFRKEGRTLKLQLSKSDVGDRSFDLCHFEDDPPPLVDTIRSSGLKILLPKDRTLFNSCGLLGELDINVTFPSEQVCKGSASDWDNSRCQDTGILSLSVYPCSPFDWKDYLCLSSTRLSDDYMVVMSKEGESDTLPIQCWAVETTVNEMGNAIWRQAKLLDTGQCGDRSQDDQVTLHTGALLTMRRKNDLLLRKCYGLQKPYFTWSQRQGHMSDSKYTTTDYFYNENMKNSLGEFEPTNYPPKSDRVRKMPNSGARGDSQATPRLAPSSHNSSQYNAGLSHLVVWLLYMILVAY